MQIKDEKAKAAFALFGEAMGFLNMAAVFAAPRLWPKVKEQPTRQRLLEAIASYERFLDVWNNSKIQRTRGPAKHFCELLSTWEMSFDPPPHELMMAARAFLCSWEAGEPPEGWDAWEGPADDEGSAS